MRSDDTVLCFIEWAATIFSFVLALLLGLVAMFIYLAAMREVYSKQSATISEIALLTKNRRYSCLWYIIMLIVRIKASNHLIDGPTIKFRFFD